MRAGLPKIIPDFSKIQTTILVVGDVMLDRYWSGETQRISAEAPVPIVNVDHIEHRAGGAANVALNLAALGVKTILLGMTGRDEAAQILASQLDEAQVTHYLHALDECSTIIKLRVMSQHQQLLRLDFEKHFDHVLTDRSKQAFFACYCEQLKQVSMVILSDYQKGTLFDTQALIQYARAVGVPLLVDPKSCDFSRYQHATIITPNYKEFERIVGTCLNEQMMVEKANALRQDLDLEALLITRSEAGMTLVQENHVMHLPAVAREIFDVTGAGDTVVAVLAASLAAGLSIEAATQLANVAAGIVIAKLGTATLSVTELQAILTENNETPRGIVNQEQLLLALESKRTLGKRIVFTNGCFDLLHAGHVTYLEAAKQLGDYLIVAVNDDDSVRALKGKERPINPLAQRLTVLAGLTAVDWVISFHEQTPERLLRLIRPDILVKGGDYQKEHVVGAEIVCAYGGEVCVLNHYQHVSSTTILKQIKSKILYHCVDHQTLL